MDTNASRWGGRTDGIFRGVSVGICVGLVDCILILLPITVVKRVLMMMGTPEMDAIYAAVTTPEVSVPIVFALNVGLVCYGVLRMVGQARWRTLGMRLSHVQDGGAVAGAPTTCA